MDRVQAQYIARRKKEDLSFMVVRFMKAHILFSDIYAEFQAVLDAGSNFEHSGLFVKIKNLEEALVFDIKEKAHFLYRSEKPEAGEANGVTRRFADLEEALSAGQNNKASGKNARKLFSALRKSLVSKSIDSYIGTGYHLFMILRESVYQLEYYVPDYISELSFLVRIEGLTRDIGYELDEEEEHELDHIRQVVKLCQSIAADTKELATIAIQRCMTLFRETAEILRHSIEESGSNEVLVLNLLKERQLVERVYGPGTWEALLEHMFRSSGEAGMSGREKAERFVRKTCGNMEALDE
jgi:hypothetical protein